MLTPYRLNLIYLAMVLPLGGVFFWGMTTYPWPWKLLFVSLWLGYGGLSFLLRCPRCKYHLHRKGPIWGPFLSRTCHGCGEKLD